MNRLTALIICSVALSGPATAADGATSTIPTTDAVPRSDNSASTQLPSTGETAQGTQALDDLILTTLANHGIAGAALAVAKQGHLVYSRGFGYADKKSGEIVEAKSRFRIASLAKPITAAAILSLYEDGHLDLDDEVLEILDEYQSTTVDREFDPRWKSITLRHLLQHSAGWDRALSGDPMFDSQAVANAMGVELPVSHDATIRYMLRRPLDFDPGERYCYSNFGYCLLGRVIEKLTGRGYEEFVRERLLKPVGITGMYVGRSERKFRGDGEVCYYDSGWGPSIFAPHRPKVPQAYGAWNLEAMDSHGGWVGSAVDLVRFAHCYYGAGEDSFLSEESLRQTAARPATASSDLREYYGLGWQVFRDDEGNLSQLSHRGSLPGTSSLLVCRGDGICYALLLNSRQSPHTDNIFTVFEDKLRQVVERIEAWPISVEIGCR